MTMPKQTIPQMLQKLDEIYNREEIIIKESRKLKLEYEQLQEDKDILQTLIMYQSNKNNRGVKNDAGGRTQDSEKIFY